MKIEITQRAKKQIRKLSSVVKIAIIKKIYDLKLEQTNLQIKKIKGYDDVFRVRVGKYRILYHQEKNQLKILAIQHRKDIYKK